MRKWTPLVVLSAAQFLMVLDQAVMNVSIGQLVEDFDTEVTKIQGAITFYALVMAALMITGGKLGDRWGRRRAFAVGHLVYAGGSLLTAISWSVPVLILGWSVLEGIGAALVLPALAALVAGNYTGSDRAAAYGVIGGVAGAGIAVGPIVGGWVTTNLSWRLVFVGEVILALSIFALARLIVDVARPGKPADIDWVGSVLSAAGLGLVIFGFLQASQWGWLSPRNSPVEISGFALTPFVIGAGVVVLYGFARWQLYREARGEEPLVRLTLLKNKHLRSGLTMYLSQNVILMGVFFAIPLYLQIVIGMNAFETGVRMLPVSVAMFLTAMAGAHLTARYSPRKIMRIGLVVLLVAIVILFGTIQPSIEGFSFALAMTLLGVGMGFVASVLGNLVQSSVGAKERGETGGLQYTAQQLGSALGTALVGAIVIGGLASSFLSLIADDPRISNEIENEVTVVLAGGVGFVVPDDVRAAATNADFEDREIDALVETYEASQLMALKAGILAGALIALGSLFITKNLPDRRFAEMAEAQDGQSGA